MMRPQLSSISLVGSAASFAAPGAKGMMFGAGLELRPMSISELMHVSERARRVEVFTGAGRRRNGAAAEKAALVAESYAPARTVYGVARRRALTPAQLFAWRRL